VGGLLDLSRIPVCALATWRHRCGGGFHQHHVVNRSKLQKNDEARRVCERRHPEIFMATVCGNANVGRLADFGEAQAILLTGKIALFGEEYVRGVWAAFADLWIVRPRLDGILYNLPEDAPRSLA